MRSRRALIVASAGIAATALTLTACSSSGNGGGNTGGNTGSTPASGGGGPQVGVILPDTTTSNRYTLYDQPLLQKAFAAAGIKATIQNAHGSASTFVSDVQIIDYDRVNLGGSAKYYVSFDNEKVGELQGQGLVDCLNTKGTKNPSIVMLNGGTDIDNNAVLFKSGAHKVLDPLFSNGTLKKGPEIDVKGWDNTVAATDFQQAYTQDPGVGGVLAANDGIAAAAISTLNQH